MLRVLDPVVPEWNICRLLLLLLHVKGPGWAHAVSPDSVTFYPNHPCVTSHNSNNGRHHANYDHAREANSFTCCATANCFTSMVLPGILYTGRIQWLLNNGYIYTANTFIKTAFWKKSEKIWLLLVIKMCLFLFYPLLFVISGIPVLIVVDLFSCLLTAVVIKQTSITLTHV